MSKTRRKRYTGAFKAKVGMEALMGVKTVGARSRLASRSAIFHPPARHY